MNRRNTRVTSPSGKARNRVSRLGTAPGGQDARAGISNAPAWPRLIWASPWTSTAAARTLVFPHHENEIAQSEAATGIEPFSRYWVHNGLLQLGDDKMSKSLGNLVSVEEALERYSPDSLRLYFLSSHYRSPLNYSDEGAASMERSADRLRRSLEHDGPDAGEPLDAAPYEERFMAAMDDDLNTPRALATLFDLAREINRSHGERSVKPAQERLRRLGEILGLTFAERRSAATDHASVEPFIELLLATRDELRKAKHFALADQIRDGLGRQGITLEDTPQGTLWQFQSGR